MLREGESPQANRQKWVWATHPSAQGGVLAAGDGGKSKILRTRRKPIPDYQFDVFLFHNSKDKPAVKWLATKLENEAKLNVFLDIWNLVPGAPWQEDLENALEASRTVAIFLGPAGISGWHNEELRNALTTRVSDRSRRIIPVLLPGTTMPEDDDIPLSLLQANRQNTQ
ncbi:MAG: toll/interleukin-1 receptor domain-containing protein [Chloroflexi bacterium]|nr:toll/interleukin-1 receptor domain-containing protein [Chloroflexota bacterium]MBU1661593.1 toll/interleukin-1 receptor domain-containing protein [Chloroflexota bacterium]